MKKLVAICFLLLAVSAYANVELKVIGLFQGVAIVKIDGKQVTLRDGDTTDNGIKLISATSNEAIFLIDGQHQRHTLSSTSTYHPYQETQEVIILSPDKHGRYRAKGSINNKKVEFVVDTGATHIAISLKDAKALGIDYLKGRDVIVETASGRIRAYAVVLKSVKLGDIEERNVPALVLEGNLPRHVLLGMTFLKSMDITQKGSLMYISQ